MKYSDKLNGFWEEGYHYYLEFQDDKLTVRDYRRSVAIETTCSYDAKALERGERTVINLKKNVLSLCWDGSPMSVIKELAYENGELKLVRCYLETEETLYTLKKADHGPFDHIIIRDDEFMDKLQGTWAEWHGNSKIVITGRNIRLELFGLEPFGEGHRFHAVSFKYSPDKVQLVPENLIDNNFSGFTAVSVEKDMLTTYMIVCDMSMPMSVFARENMLDKIEVPDAAKREPRNTMMHVSEPPMFKVNTPPTGIGGMMGYMSMNPFMNGGSAPSAAPDPAEKPAAAPGCCPNCGYDPKGETPRFCPECGTKLR